MSDIERLKTLRQAGKDAAARDLALEMLGRARRRDMVDAALYTLERVDLDDSVRPLLREKALYYFDQIKRDSGALLREKIVRLLAALNHPEDVDIYRRGLDAYEPQPVRDVAQNLRAVSLAGLAQHDPATANFYAAKFLSEMDDISPFNGEPAITAINLLTQQSQPLVLYQYLVLGGLDALEAGLNEVVGKALESLGPDFPPALYAELTDLFAPRDRAVVSMGLMTHIVEHRVTSLYDRLEPIITGTRHDDLHHFAVILLAASRDNTLINLLFRLAKVSPPYRRASFIEALALVPTSEARELAVQLADQS